MQAEEDIQAFLVDTSDSLACRMGAHRVKGSQAVDTASSLVRVRNVLVLRSFAVCHVGRARQLRKDVVVAAAADPCEAWAVLVRRQSNSHSRWASVRRDSAVLGAQQTGSRAKGSQRHLGLRVPGAGRGMGLGIPLRDPMPLSVGSHHGFQAAHVCIRDKVREACQGGHTAGSRQPRFLRWTSRPRAHASTSCGRVDVRGGFRAWSGVVAKNDAEADFSPLALLLDVFCERSAAWQEVSAPPLSGGGSVVRVIAKLSRTGQFRPRSRRRQCCPSSSRWRRDYDCRRSKVVNVLMRCRRTMCGLQERRVSLDPLPSVQRMRLYSVCEVAQCQLKTPSVHLCAEGKP